MKILRKFRVKFLTDIPQTQTYEVQNLEVEVEVDDTVCSEKTVSRAIVDKINDMWSRDEIDPVSIGYERDLNSDCVEATIYDVTFEEVVDKVPVVVDPNQMELFNGM